jgi:hypothetical protein
MVANVRLRIIARGIIGRARGKVVKALHARLREEGLYKLFILSLRLLHPARANLKLINRMDADRNPGHSVDGVSIIDFLFGFLQRREVPVSITHARHAR